MTDLGPSTSLMELPGVSLRIRPRSASEAIRRRVNQRLASTGNNVEPPELIQTSYSAQASYSKSELMSPSTPASPDRDSHSLKRKKTQKADNRGPDTSLESQRMGRSFIKKRPHSHYHDSEQIDRTSDDQPAFTGPIAVSEVDKLRKEVNSLKQALHESKRLNKRQSKKYDESKVELSSTIQALKDKESELISLKERYTKRDELVSTIESSVQCQICMDLPDRPFALAPCGHILCLTCLQEWFRKAPPALDDVDIDPDDLSDSRYVLMRSKSCPTCRAVVKHRPVPVFMVGAITGAFRKSKLSNGSLIPENRDSESHRDPWKGIFPSSEEEDEATEDVGLSSEESESDFDFRVGVRTAHYFRRRAVRRAMFRAIYSSTISDEDEDVEDSSESDDDGQLNSSYIRPRWTPPSVDVALGEFNLSEEQDPVGTFKLLQRGCTWEMIQNYDLSYDHSSGIILSLRSLNHLYASDDDDDDDGPEPQDMNRIFLGWNITLDDVDVDGEAFICQVIEDIKRSPLRWEVTPRVGVPGALDARKLMPPDEVVDYDTTDTEIWMDSDVF